MKFYPKKLHSLEELKREKRALKEAEKHTGASSILNTDDLLSGLGSLSFNNKEEKSSPAGNAGSTLLNLASGLLSSQPLLAMIVNMAAPVLGPKIGKASASILKRVGTEFVGGYVKWKAMQLGVRGIRFLVKKRKERKATKEAIIVKK